MPLLEVDNLSIRFGGLVALDGVSFEVEAGKIMGLIGPNGAGKTTTMKMLTGYLAPSEGSARIAGLDVHQDRIAASRKLGYLPENGPLYLDMTPLELLEFFGEARELDAKTLKRRIEEVRAFCALHDVLEKPIGKLSRGLRQRVGLAQALLHDPDVLIMDEPTAALGPEETTRVAELIERLKGEGLGIFLVSHDLHDVFELSDRLAVLKNGKLVGVRNTSEVSRGEVLEMIIAG